MKIIKEWEWDYKALRLSHQWHIQEDDFDGDSAFVFVLFDFVISKKLFGITLFNFGISYQWDI